MTIEGRVAEISRRSALGFAGLMLAALAAPLAPLPAWGQGGSGFVVRGIAAEAAAETATAARERAIAGGLRSAWAALLAREAPGEQARLGAISAEELERLVESYEVENERVGAQRYAATLTVAFRPEPVRRLLAARPASGPSGRIEVTAPLNGLSDWVAIRQRLAGSPAIRGYEVLALSRREARLALTLPGGQAEAAAALASAGLALRDGPGGPTLGLVPGT
ncbi:hypothetical protein [Elioraea sp.]|uniref:hypothetical protein n=1 Tax=Elioraea sp. TaxID=2185103 RepID=UPI0025C07DA0|nr:hypothetical protein [Elioraea sp.]